VSIVKFTCYILLYVSQGVIISQDLGEWFVKAPMPTPRQEMSSTVIGNKIYISGGLVDWYSDGLDVFEVYDINTDSWETLEPMPIGLHHHSITAVNDKIYVFGGLTKGILIQQIPSEKMFEYDINLNTWQEKTLHPYDGIAMHTAVEYEGKIYIFGGRSEFNSSIDDGWVYDPLLDQWDWLSVMPTFRDHLTSTVLDTLIFVIGGRILDPGPGLFINLDAVEFYSPSSDQWYIGEGLPTARGALASATLNGRIYVFGGEYPGIYEQNEEYDYTTDSWRQMTPMLTPRHSFGAVTINDTIYLIGGGDQYGVSPSNVNEAFTVSKTSDISNSEHPISSIDLYQNYPNPFNPFTKITYSISEISFVTLKVYDVLGSEISTLVNEEKTFGSYEVEFDATDLPSGIYFYRLQAGSFVQTKNMALLK
jgi:N-acetylneuraminic acid mutarotase